MALAGAGAAGSVLAEWPCRAMQCNAGADSDREAIPTRYVVGDVGIFRTSRPLQRRCETLGSACLTFLSLFFVPGPFFPRFCLLRDGDISSRAEPHSAGPSVLCRR